MCERASVCPTTDRLGTVFGLDVRSDTPLHFIEDATAPATGRAIELLVDRSDNGRLRTALPGELICSEHFADGGVAFRIWEDAGAGYLVSGPGHGDHWLSPDGKRLRCVPENDLDARWQRLLIAQALPFAALLQGLEVFHASAVVCDGRAVGIIGPSGVGKTSLALELTRRGAKFLADDVLALERQDEQLLAHPGTPLAGIDEHAATAAWPDEGERIAMSSGDERMVAVSAASKPTQLTNLFFIERRADGPAQPEFSVVGDPRLLLGATFNFLLVTPERLHGLLDVCALAAQGAVERVLAGPATDVDELCTALERRLA
jgi:hypothetical protein